MTIRNKEVSVSKWMQNKKVVMTISLVCAIIFWGIINVSESPNITRDIHNVPVTISLEGTAAKDVFDLEVVGGEERTVTVTVSGPRYIVAGLTADDIDVTASMDYVTAAGNQSVPLIATRGSDKSGYTILGISPATITLTLDTFVTKEIAVEIDSIANMGIAAVDGLSCDNPIFSADKYSKITITGPKAQMDKLSKVKAEVKANTVLSETKSFEAEIVLYDKDGNSLDTKLFTMQYSTVSITVPVFKTKSVPLQATFKNMPTGVSAPSYDLDIKTVDVKGSAAEIDALEYLNLTPIDYNAITQDKMTFICTLGELNGSIRPVADVGSIKVTIHKNK